MKENSLDLFVNDVKKKDGMLKEALIFLAMPFALLSGDIFLYFL